MYGIWNGMRKEFQFGIAEETKSKALNKLRSKIGKDANKWRFEVRELPNDHKFSMKGVKNELRS